jgi:Zinc finger, C3HC4 type (RING finger)
MICICPSAVFKTGLGSSSVIYVPFVEALHFRLYAVCCCVSHMSGPEYDEALKRLVAELTCAICNSVYVTPVSLPCTHVFCNACVRSKLEGVGVYKNECPTCKSPSFVRDLRSNTKVQAVARITQFLLQQAQQAQASAPGGSAHADDGAASPAGLEEALPHVGVLPEDLPTLCDALHQWMTDVESPDSEQLDTEQLDALDSLLEHALGQLKTRLKARGITLDLPFDEQRDAASVPPGVEDARLRIEKLRPSQLRTLCAHFAMPAAKVATWGIARLRQELSKCDHDLLEAILAAEGC